MLIFENLCQKIFCVGVNVDQPTQFWLHKNQLIKPVRMIPFATIISSMFPFNIRVQEQITHFDALNDRFRPITLELMVGSNHQGQRWNEHQILHRLIDINSMFYIIFRVHEQKTHFYP